MARGKLGEYQRKRDFGRTSEPRGRTGRSRRQPRFVVQKHDATRLHYDFRLEHDGVLKSWAVPKGPSLNPDDKRLAQPTEDHPVGYIDFEGTIPQGEYGAGPVIVWDTGTYENITERDGEPVPMDQALADGHVSFRLNGEKLTGTWSLTRMRTGKGESWLLIKRTDEHADRRRKPVKSAPKSVLTGRTVEEVADEQ
jgi:DNA ligase D-like protein (predicted 3'-phosphoesterase)